MATVATNQPRSDPSGTRSISNEYEGAFEEWFEALGKRISPQSFNQDISEPPAVFRFTENDEKIRAFMRWLREQEQAGVLTIIERDENTYVRRAYNAGIRHADAQLRASGLAVDDALSAYALPVTQRTLQTLFTRNYDELRGITEEMNREISRVLTTGFQQGHGPYRIASDIADTVDEIGLQRSRLLARTEVINAHSTAAVRRYEQLGVERLGLQAELLTSGDKRVCPLCRAAASRGPYTIERVKTGTFRYQSDEDEPDSLSGEYPIKPPLHPSCRCTLITT